jgi:DNA processing protein
METRTVRRGEPDYPESLEKLSDPPLSLRVVGALFDGPMVAIVGSRKADTAACRFTRKLAAELSSQGVGIISGGALGIDTVAHLGALDAKGKTLAVIGSGYNYLYPSDNRRLFETISKTGALMTEFADEQPPARWTFPKRNRLVAALADGVVVVQAAVRSGALITASYAKDLGVPVGATPGIPADPRNRGNHDLIRQGASLVEDVNDAIALIHRHRRNTAQLRLPGLDPSPTSARKSVNGHTVAETKILEILCTRPLHIDDIATCAGLSPSAASAAILTLELQGIIEDQGGKNFVRVG